MELSRRLQLLVLSAVISWPSLGGLTARGQAQSKKPQPESLPTVDYENSDESGDNVEKEIRRARGSHYKNGGPFHVENLPPGTYPLPLNDHSWGGPGIPSQSSDAIVVGTVLHYQAYLTDTKNQVYSEFTIQVEKQLKTTDGSTLGPMITVERWGGGVKMSDGRVLRYKKVHARMPRLEKRYVFLLKYLKDGLDFDLVTAYEIKDGQIHPLDSFREYAEYEGWTENAFLKAVSESIENGRGGH
jgi:hypothetical protein